MSVSLPASLTTPITATSSHTNTICILSVYCFSYTVPGSVTGGALSIDQYNYQRYGSGPTFNISGLRGIAATDAAINAQYNVQTNQITLDNVNAAQAGGSVVLHGAIFNTNTLGNITVNGGLGHVSIDNQTGIPLVLQNIATGNNVQSSVTSGGSPPGSTASSRSGTRSGP